jgi:hypothetical protein
VVRQNDVPITTDALGLKGPKLRPVIVRVAPPLAGTLEKPYCVVTTGASKVMTLISVPTAPETVSPRSIAEPVADEDENLLQSSDVVDAHDADSHRKASNVADTVESA